MGKLGYSPSKIERYSPVDGVFFLITGDGHLLGKAWDLESARIIAKAFDQANIKAEVDRISQTII